MGRSVGRVGRAAYACICIHRNINTNIMYIQHIHINYSGLTLHPSVFSFCMLIDAKKLLWILHTYVKHAHVRTCINTYRRTEGRAGGRTDIVNHNSWVLTL